MAATLGKCWTRGIDPYRVVWCGSIRGACSARATGGRRSPRREAGGRSPAGRAGRRRTPATGRRRPENSATGRARRHRRHGELFAVVAQGLDHGAGSGHHDRAVVVDGEQLHRAAGRVGRRRRVRRRRDRRAWRSAVPTPTATRTTPRRASAAASACRDGGRDRAKPDVLVQAVLGGGPQRARRRRRPAAATSSAVRPTLNTASANGTDGAEGRPRLVRRGGRRRHPHHDRRVDGQRHAHGLPAGRGHDPAEERGGDVVGVALERGRHGPARRRRRRCGGATGGRTRCDVGGDAGRRRAPRPQKPRPRPIGMGERTHSGPRPPSRRNACTAGWPSSAIAPAVGPPARRPTSRCRDERHAEGVEAGAEVGRRRRHPHDHGWSRRRSAGRLRGASPAARARRRPARRRARRRRARCPRPSTSPAPPTTSPAAALSTTTSRCGPRSPASTRPGQAGVGGRVAADEVLGRRRAASPSSAGSTGPRRGRRRRRAPTPSTSSVVVSSSRPSSPCTTSTPAWRRGSAARRASARPATGRPRRPPGAAPGPGWPSGPRMLNAVGMPSSRRGGPAWRSAGWNAGREAERHAGLPRRSAATSSGASSIATPSASSRSADAARRRRGPVAVLAHRHAGAGDDERRQRRDVDGVAAVAAGADDVDGAVAPRLGDGAPGRRPPAWRRAGRSAPRRSRPSCAGRRRTRPAGPAWPRPSRISAMAARAWLGGQVARRRRAGRARPATRRGRRASSSGEATRADARIRRADAAPLRPTGDAGG